MFGKEKGTTALRVGKLKKSVCLLASLWCLGSKNLDLLVIKTPFVTFLLILFFFFEPHKWLFLC